LCGHDFHNLGHGVRKAVKELIASADAIEIKEVIRETYLWFAVVDNPAYEYELAEIEDLYRAGNARGALNRALNAAKRYHDDKLFSMITTLKAELSQSPLSGALDEAGTVSGNRVIALADQEIMTISVVPEAAAPEEQALLAALKTIDTLIQPKEAVALFRLCRLLRDGARILEIGSYQGASTVAMGRAVKDSNGEITCLDLWANYLEQQDFVDFERDRVADDLKILENFVANTAFIGKKLHMLRGECAAFASLLKGQNYDFIFIDGAHDYPSVRRDMKVALSALKPGGFLCGHDYHDSGHGVRRAVSEMIGSADSIVVKGRIWETSLWFCVVDDPMFEFTMTEIDDLYNSRDLKAALSLARELSVSHPNSELQSVIATLEAELN
jgi:predicted O-methyltransferase YrrM